MIAASSRPSWRDWATSVPSRVHSSPSSSKNPSLTSVVRKAREQRRGLRERRAEVDREVDRRRGAQGIGQTGPDRGVPRVRQQADGGPVDRTASRSVEPAADLRSSERVNGAPPKRGCIPSRSANGGAPGNGSAASAAERRTASSISPTSGAGSRARERADPIATGWPSCSSRAVDGRQRTARALDTGRAVTGPTCGGRRKCTLSERG